MRFKLFFSWVVLIAGAIYGANLSYSGRISADPLVSALSWGYLLWALYWGIPVVWRWWRGYAARNNQATSLLGQLLWFVLGLFIPLVGGYFYGVFGGAIYQFLRSWWKVRNQNRA